jgi:hypothetical protein
MICQSHCNANQNIYFGGYLDREHNIISPAHKWYLKFAILVYHFLGSEFHFSYVIFCQTPTQPLRGDEKNAMFHMSIIIIDLIQSSHVLHYKPYFSTISFDDCQNLQWWLGLVWLWHQKHVCSAKPQSREFLYTIRSCLVTMGFLDLFLICSSCCLDYTCHEIFVWLLR